MAYVPIPKDLAQVKTKIALNLTKRQIICFSAALIVGLPVFFGLRLVVGTDIAAFAMIAACIPFFLIAMYEKDGLPFEKVARHMIRVRFLRPKARPYRTENLYALLMKQGQLDREVKAIAQSTTFPSHSEKRTRDKPAGP